jgi:hypothetical protein
MTTSQHIHSSDGNCDCHYPVKRCVGCGVLGKPNTADDRFICSRCERMDYSRREF